MMCKVLTLTLLIALSGCLSKPVTNNGIALISSDTTPKDCSVIDSFKVYSPSRIKSFYALSEQNLSNEVNVALYNVEEHRAFEKKAWDLKYEKMVEDYFLENPKANSLPIDFCCVPTGTRNTDKSIKPFYGVLLSCK